MSNSSDQAPRKPEPEFWRRRRLIRESTLSSSQRLLLHTLADYLGSSDTCWPAATSLADDMGLSRRQAQALIAELRSAGILVSKRRGMGLSNLTSVEWGQIPQRPEAQSTALQEAQPTAPQKRDTSHNESAAGRAPEAQSTALQEAQPTAPKRPTEHPKKHTPPKGAWGDLGIKSRDLKKPLKMFQHFRNAVAAQLVPDDDDSLIDWMRLSSYVFDQSERDDKHQAFAPNLLFIRLAKDRDFRGTDENERKAKEAIQQIKNYHATYHAPRASAPGRPP